MTSLAVRVLSGLQAQRLVARNDRVVAALSGGPDSVALTAILLEVLPELGASLAGLAHLHHGLRGADADRDERFCREYAGRLHLPIVVEHVDVAACALEAGLSIESAGHVARYAFYERARRQLEATLVATGHTRDDLAETFLMRAARGAGPRGLAGIRPRVGTVVRPLLDVARAEVVDELAALGLPSCEDATNRDTRLTRNRVRHEVLPLLERFLGPGVTGALARAARVVAADEEFLEEAATRAGVSVVSMTADGLALDGAAAASLPLALRRRVVLAALERVTGRRATFATVDRVLGMLAEGCTRPALLPGVRVTPVAAGLTVRRQPRRVGTAPATVAGVPSPVRLAVPGTVDLPAGGTIVASPRGGPPERPDRIGADDAVIDATRIQGPLFVRFRRPGDRIRPLGMAGRKKLQDVLVDRKVPREIRDHVPLVVDAGDRIVWVAGHVVAEDVRVTPATTSVLLLQYRRSC